MITDISMRYIYELWLTVFHHQLLVFFYINEKSVQQSMQHKNLGKMAALGIHQLMIQVANNIEYHIHYPNIKNRNNNKTKNIG